MPSNEQVSGTAAETLKCNICEAEASVKCSYCKKTGYCSVDHLAKDSDAHKNNCDNGDERKRKSEKKKKKIPTTVGSRFSVNAILFPADETSPRVVKAEYEVVRDSNIDPDENFHKPLSLNTYLGAQAGHKFIDMHNWPNDTPFEGETGISLFFRDNCNNDGSRPNQSVRYVCNGQPGFDWAGNILAVYSTDKFVGQVGDLEVDLLPDIVSFFKNYGKQAPQAQRDMQQMLTSMGFQIIEL